MTPETLRRYARPVPRYTSYPTAPHFSEDVGPSVYRSWLAALGQEERLSVYLHVPFCDQLCWYCGCNTKATRQYVPVKRYVDYLLLEIDLVCEALKGKKRIGDHIHFGGGSPSILSPEDILRVGEGLRKLVSFSPDLEFAVEVDPRSISEERIAAFAEAGMNRVSVGVQDFSPAVQRAINREQSLEMTREVIEGFRHHGVGSVNIDLVYGLPYQTLESVARTIDQVVELAPDRVALFGYAHLPQRLTHQRLINEEALPDMEERFAQANRAAHKLVQAGYERIGFDHFARPGDRLSCGEVRRNFQGYTSDGTETLIALGASAIGRLSQGYVQNSAAVGEYQRLIGLGDFATKRGHAMSQEDIVRSMVIERLMCSFHFPERELKERYGGAAEEVVEEARMLLESEGDGLLERDSEGDGFRVTEKGRLFVRSIASVFDRYLGKSEAMHSSGV